MLASSDVSALVRRALALAAAAGLATAAAGCSPPECQATRLGEVKSHGSSAIDDALDLEARAALDELGIGLGIVPHASMPLAGAMPVVLTPEVLEPVPDPALADPPEVVPPSGDPLPSPVAGDS